MTADNQRYDPSRQWSSRRPKQFSGILGRVIASLGLSNNYDGWQVVTHFAEIVGSPIADKATAVGYEDGCLFVAVPDAVWRQEIAMRHDELLKKVHNLPYGRAVRQIRLVQGTKGFERDGD